MLAPSLALRLTIAANNRGYTRAVGRKSVSSCTITSRYSASVSRRLRSLRRIAALQIHPALAADVFRRLGDLEGRRHPVDADAEDIDAGWRYA